MQSMYSHLFLKLFYSLCSEHTQKMSYCLIPCDRKYPLGSEINQWLRPFPILYLRSRKNKPKELISISCWLWNNGFHINQPADATLCTVSQMSSLPALTVSQQCLARPGHGLLGACALLPLVSCAALIVFTPPPPPPPPWSSTLDDHAGPLQGGQRRFHLSRGGEVIAVLLVVVMLNVTTNLSASVLWCSELSFPSTGFENHPKIMGSGL